MLTIHTMFNDNFMGDTEYLRAVTVQLSSQFVMQPVKKEYQDCAQDAVALFIANLDQENQHILLISGTHGLDFLNAALKDQKIQDLIKAKKLIISWGGHQAPKDLQTLEGNLAVVSLVQESIDKPLEDIFGARLISTRMVPNTLNVKTLATALAEWHKKYSGQEDFIPPAANGYIGVFLGGDAPDEECNHKCYTAEEAFEQGKVFALEAKRTGKVLLATNGPRMGKIYPESPDPKRPVLTRFNDHGEWVAFDALTESDLKTDPAADYKAHAVKAPIDPVSAAFIAGIQATSLTKERYRFIDFRFGKSAYQAIIAALRTNKDNSIAYYSGESVSYAEIGYFIPNTYAFEVGSMSNRHKTILARFCQELHLVGKADLTKDGVRLNEIDHAKKQQTLMSGTDQDAKNIAKSIVAYVCSIDSELVVANMGKPLTWAASRDATDIQSSIQQAQAILVNFKAQIGLFEFRKVMAEIEKKPILLNVMVDDSTLGAGPLFLLIYEAIYFSTDADIDPAMFQAYKQQMVEWLKLYDKSTIDLDLLSKARGQNFAHIIFPFIFLYIAPHTAQELVDIIAKHTTHNKDVIFKELSETTLLQAYSISRLDAETRARIVDFIQLMVSTGYLATDFTIRVPDTTKPLHDKLHQYKSVNALEYYAMLEGYEDFKDQVAQSGLKYLA